MRLLHLVVAIAASVAAIGNDITTFANEVTETNTRANLILDTALSHDVAIRKLPGYDEELEERRGGGGHGGGGHGGGGHGVSGGHAVSGGDGVSGGHATTTTGGGDTTTTGGGYVYRGGYVYGTHNGAHSDSGSRKKKKKCNRFTNWFKRLFNKNIKKCPKKGEEEDTRRLRANE
ncbi:hypothetical protein V7S43_015805 [Phytophthora oleae]|uniref:RxLR effector protein n=1 Tax=Phytophthora oleae TaxID=2107226 RepID=A0ABD3EZV0_9STRA